MSLRWRRVILIRGLLLTVLPKAGLNLLGLSLAREGATIGVGVYTVAPGETETGMLRSLISTDQLPVGAAMDPMDVARVIAECAAGDLKFTSGEVIWMHK